MKKKAQNYYNIPAVKTTFSLKKAIKAFTPNNVAPKGIKRKEISDRAVILAAIYGDIIGQPYEGITSLTYISTKIDKEDLIRSNNRYTDDTVMTIATAEAIKKKCPFWKSYKWWGNAYPDKGYGSNFYDWLISDDVKKPFGSYGNGSAMRVSPCALVSNNVKKVIKCAYKSAIATHNHYEGIKGAVVTAVCMWLALYYSAEDIDKYMREQYGPEYKNDFALDYKDMTSYSVICQYSVPLAVKLVLSSNSYNDFCYNACIIGGDTDTVCAIGGPIAAILYGFPYDTDTINVVKLLDARIEKVLREWD